MEGGQRGKGGVTVRWIREQGGNKGATVYEEDIESMWCHAKMKIQIMIGTEYNKRERRGYLPEK